MKEEDFVINKISIPGINHFVKPDFKDLGDLHLECLEDKKKLKRGLPLIPLKKKIKKNTKEKLKNNEDKKKAPKQAVQEEEIEIPTLIEENDESEEFDLADTDDEEKIVDENIDEDELIEDLGEEEEVYDEEIEDEDDEDMVSPEEKEENEKQEYVWRFKILKKQYSKTHPGKIPEFNEYSDIQIMKSTYNSIVKELYLDDSVDSYRTYLFGAWVAMEYLCTQWLGIDIEGFAVQQMNMMDKYEKMLVELGEKSYSRWASSIPVEARLLGLVIFNVLIFYIGKLMADKYGKKAADFFKGFTGQPPDENNETEEVKDKPRKKMKGPKIRPEDIRKNN